MAAILESIPISDRVEILKCYRNLLRASSSILTWKDIKQIREAIELSMQKTGFERHPSGKLVLVHSLEVARVTVEDLCIAVRTRKEFRDYHRGNRKEVWQG